jgi:hypothetical protein
VDGVVVGCALGVCDGGVGFAVVGCGVAFAEVVCWAVLVMLFLVIDGVEGKGDGDAVAMTYSERFRFHRLTTPNLPRLDRRSRGLHC